MTTPALLIQCPLWGFVPPIALAQLSSSLSKAGLSSRCVDLNIGLFHRRGAGHRHTWAWENNTIWLDDAVVAEVLGAHDGYIVSACVDPLPEDVPSLVGFSVNECSMRSSLHVARRIKALRPKAFVLFGGQAFAEPERIERCLRSGVVDAVAFADGEATVVDVARALAQGRAPESCPGLRVLRGGAVVSTGEREPVDLDALPFLDYAALDLAAYDVPDNLYQRSLMIMASRGCIRRCEFCGNRAPWEGYRFMSGRRIFDEIKHQLAEHPGRFSELKFYDIVVNGDMRRTRELCGLIVADPSVRLSWEEVNCVVRPEMDLETLRLMRAAGCHRITYGIESGSDRVLRLMRKGQTSAMAERVLRDTHEAGLVTTANFMFGYPGETEADFEETLEFARRVHPYVDMFYPSRTFVTMEPLSPMARRREELGVDDGHDVYWSTLDGANTYPVRLARYERFSRLLKELGANESPGVNSSLELWRWSSLAQYHEQRGDAREARRCYEECLKLDPDGALVRARLESLKEAAS